VGVAAQRLVRAEESLVGASRDDAVAACAEIAADEAEPVEDANGSVQYKRQLVRVLVSRCLRDALAPTDPAAEPQ
jgi:CO/xanthine dehydrogenase FAD-binding subunit